MAVQLHLEGRKKDLGGGFTVSRLLPAASRRSVGPFVFFDHFGPATARPELNHDVRPHPHIGLATVTYLFEGAMMHRDSLGSQQRIEPGAINLMTAGRGIVHSERKPDDLRERSLARGRRYGQWRPPCTSICNCRPVAPWTFHRSPRKWRCMRCRVRSTWTGSPSGQARSVVELRLQPP